MQRILISACLLGRPVRYDGSGKSVSDGRLAAWQSEGRLVPICPEVTAGLPTPRPPAEIAPGGSGAAVLAGQARILERDGRDVTRAFLAGAEAALALARETGCRFALLTDGSPSCGSGFVHAGRFDGATVAGTGVVAALLQQHGVAVFAETEIDRLAKALDPR